MKYLKNTLILIIVVIVISPTNHIFAKSPTYAQIKNSNTFLYKSAESYNNNSKLCMLEKSYFVKILNNYNTDYYKVEYNGINGFVKKSEIMLINEIPSNPYPNVTFNISSSCYLRSSPKIKDMVDNTITTIPTNTKNLRYIGKVIGEEAVDLKGGVWYLTEYNGSIGYVYSSYTYMVNTITNNIENVTEYKGETYEKVNPLTNMQCLVIITLTLLPTLLILYLLYKPKKSRKLKVVRKIPTVDIYDENL